MISVELIIFASISLSAIPHYFCFLIVVLGLLMERVFVLIFIYIAHIFNAVLQIFFSFKLIPII